MAAVLEEQGNHEVKIIDSPVHNLDNNQVVDIIKKENPDLLGITATTYQRFSAIKILEKVAELPIIKVVGGIHFSCTDVDALQHIPVDIVVRGEGEYTLLDIVDGTPLESIPGISYKKNGRIIRNKDREFLDLNKLPNPARHLFPMKDYSSVIMGEHETKCTSIMTSRGCPNQCIFCSSSAHWKRRLRLRDPIKVVDEIEEISTTYGIRGFDIWDDTLTISRKHIEGICNELIKRNLDIVWFGLIRVNTVDKNILELMKKAGCVSIAFGVESGSPRILKEIKKNITLEQVEKVSKICNDLEFNIIQYIMFNHPTETIKDLEMTLDFQDRLESKYENLRAIRNQVTIYPGTVLEKIAINKGIIPKDFSWNSPYYSEKYTKFGLNPTIPVFENIPLEDIHSYITWGNKKRLFRKGLRKLCRVKTSGELYKFTQKFIRK